jgi:hypothetical protein
MQHHVEARDFRHTNETGFSVGNWFRTADKEVSEETATNLKRWIAERTQHEKNIEILGVLKRPTNLRQRIAHAAVAAGRPGHRKGTQEVLEDDPWSATRRAVDGVKAVVEIQLARVKRSIKNTGFSWKYTQRQCMADFKEDTAGNGADNVARISEEIQNQVSDDDDGKHSKCHELPGDTAYCPEGTIPDSRRDFDSVKFAKVSAGIFFVYKPSAMLIGGAIGFMVGGPVGAAAFSTAAAFPGPGFIVPLPIAAAVATDWWPRCRCYPKVCDFDYSLGYCLMPGGDSKNPFTRLPYPGFKCVQKGRRVADKSVPGGYKVECELTTCEEPDLARTSLNNTFGLIGTIGYQPGTENVNNCLAVSGEAGPESLLAQMRLPPENGAGAGEQKGTANTPQLRVALYEKLGVSFEPAAGYRVTSPVTVQGRVLLP